MYQSPIRLAGFTELQQGARPLKSALLVARRKLEAEFELADSPTITYGGQELNRQEVVSLFDELRNEERLAWHMAIYGDAALLRFLEEGALHPGAAWAANPVYADSRFIHFVSPFFAAAINAFYRKLLSGAAPLASLQTLASNPSFMMGRDAEQAFRHVTRYFLEKKNELMRLQQRAEASEAVLRQEVRDVISEAALRVLNYLPDSYDDLRYQVANTLNNLCVAFDQKSYRRHALLAIEKAALISVNDEELQALIPRNLNIIRSKQTGSFFRIDGQGKKQPKWGWIAAIFLVLIRVTAWLAEDERRPDFDIRYLPSFNTTQASVFTPQPRLTFNSLVFSLLGGEPDSFRFQMVSESFTAQEPKETGAPLLSDLLQREFAPNAPDTGSAAKVLQVRNTSSWHLLLCYSFNDRAFGIRYIAPGDRYLFRYSADTIDALLVAGKDWDAQRHYIFNSHPSMVTTQIHGITGGYNTHPENMRTLLDADGTPVFRRADTAGVKSLDILHVTDSTGNTISVRSWPGNQRNT